MLGSSAAMSAARVILWARTSRRVEKLGSREGAAGLPAAVPQTLNNLLRIEHTVRKLLLRVVSSVALKSLTPAYTPARCLVLNINTLFNAFRMPDRIHV